MQMPSLAPGGGKHCHKAVVQRWCKVGLVVALKASHLTAVRWHESGPFGMARRVVGLAFWADGRAVEQSHHDPVTEHPLTVEPSLLKHTYVHRML